MHRENVDQISLQHRFGRKVFTTLLRELNDILIIVLAQSEGIPATLKLSERDSINIAYQCFFYGTSGEASQKLINNALSKYPEWKERILNACRQTQRGMNQKYSYKVLEGHQSRLSHYYRHLFQTVKYVNEKKGLDYRRKYEYVKILRAQLSTHEQALLFFNSLSEMGSPWEQKLGLTDNQRLITKYNLVKNIPAGFVTSVNIKTLYPDVHYEGDEKSVRRKELEISYL
jgi:hypothetical protein